MAEDADPDDGAVVKAGPVIGIHHADDSGNFYVSEYYGRWVYKTVKKKVKVKVKWKKVWKYKTKTKKVKKKVKDYWARDDYVYFIGTFQEILAERR